MLDLLPLASHFHLEGPRTEARPGPASGPRAPSSKSDTSFCLRGAPALSGQDPPQPQGGAQGVCFLLRRLGDMARGSAGW